MACFVGKERTDVRQEGRRIRHKEERNKREVLLDRDTSGGYSAVFETTKKKPEEGRSHHFETRRFHRDRVLRSKQRVWRKADLARSEISSGRGGTYALGAEWGGEVDLAGDLVVPDRGERRVFFGRGPGFKEGRRSDVDAAADRGARASKLSVTRADVEGEPAICSEDVWDRREGRRDRSGGKAGWIGREIRSRGGRIFTRSTSAGFVCASAFAAATDLAFGRADDRTRSARDEAFKRDLVDVAGERGGLRLDDDARSRMGSRAKPPLFGFGRRSAPRRSRRKTVVSRVAGLL